MRRAPGKLVALGAVAALALSLGAGGASGAVQAAEQASNVKTQYLDSTPNQWMENSTVERRMYLAAGWYRWQMHPVSSCYRELYLGQGWYTWRDVLDPANGYYTHQSILDPDNSAWAPAQLNCRLNVISSRIQTWGSVLVPL